MCACLSLRPRGRRDRAARHAGGPWHALCSLLCAAVLTVCDATSPYDSVLADVSNFAGGRNNGGRSLQNAGGEIPEEQKRPLKVAFYYDLGPTPPDIAEYIQETLMPAAASLLSRWLRVRSPT